MKKILFFFLALILSKISFSQISMTNGSANTYSVCGKNFYDAGGAAGTYSNNINSQEVLYSSNASTLVTTEARLQIVVNSCKLAPSDILYLYDAYYSTYPTLISYSLIATFSGTVTGNPTYTTTLGFCKFMFSSDASGVSNGWDISINCLTPSITAVSNSSLNNGKSYTVGISGANTFFELNSPSKSVYLSNGTNTVSGSSINAVSSNSMNVDFLIPCIQSAPVYTLFASGFGQGTLSLNNAISSNLMTASLTYTDISCSSGLGYANSIMSFGNGPFTYTWSGSGVASGVNSSSVSVNSIGIYTCTINDFSGCSTTQTVLISNSPPPTVSVTNTTVCNGNFATLTATGATTYSWNTGATTSSISVSPTSNTTYTVTGTNGSCSNTKTVSVAVNPKPAATLSFTNPSCGQNNGVISIMPTNTVSISTITSTSGTVIGQTITGLGVGTPTITLTSNLGCTFTISTTLTQSSPLTLTSTLTPATCSLPNGSGTVTIGGGTVPYSYNWSNGGVTNVLTAASAGIYTVTVTDFNGCVLTRTVNITNIAGPTAITGSSSPASCAGATGSYSVTGVSGGVATYSYSVDGAAFTTPTVMTNLSSGTHTIAVKDANGCTFATTFSVGVVAGVTSATVTATTASCGIANATATVTAILGGVPSYSFSFDGGAFTGSSSISGLAAGNHTVIIRDANACNLSIPFTVINTGSPTTSITNFLNVSCFGLSNGSCTLAIPTGGAGGPFTYTLTSPFQSNGVGVFNGLPAGAYNISVQDAAGCIATTSVIIGQPAALTVSATATAVLCNGGSTGSISLSGFGGTPTYSYNLNGGAYQASSTFSNQVAGIYTMGIKDANGCIATQTVSIAAALSPTISVTSPTICSGGTANLTASGATTYLWSAGSTNSSISVTPTITTVYTVTGTTNGCISTETVSVTVNPKPSVITSFTNSTCGNIVGIATAAITNGTSPYTTQWSNGDFGLTADSLAAGQYVVQVTDANGCYNSTIVNINTANGPSISTASITNVSCPGGNNGAISISAVGGSTPYTYLWSNGITTSSVSSLYAGVYDVTVTDANNCVVIQTYSVSQPLPLNIIFTSTAALCGSNNGSLSANVTGGTLPYNYLWSSNAASQTTVTAVNLSAGIYSCVVTDNKGCQISGSGAVASSTSGPALSFVTTDAGGCGNSNGGTIDMTVTGGSTYTYQWSNGATTEDIGNLAPDNYLVVVTNTNNCSSTGSVTILNASGNINPTICIITVDTITGTNLVVWEKPATANGIQSYNIYREGSALGVYNLVHTQPFSALSQYTDPTANPAVRGWRYKITYLDSCGNETDLSIHHKTIHLAVNQGIGNTVNLAWDQYEGFAYQTFYILRKHASTGWVQIDALPSNLYSYTDLNPPLSGALRYMIEVAPTSGYSCNSTAKGITTTINTTRSNTKDKTSLTPTDIKENVLFDVNLFPNPAKDVLHISTTNQLITSVKVYDITARLLSQVSLQNNDNKIDISIKDFASGIYLAEIQTAKGIVRKQFVKE